MTIKDLFIKEQSYTVTLPLTDEYYLYIEALTKNGEAIQDEKFNVKSLTENLCVELIKVGEDVIDNVELNMTYSVEAVKDIMEITLKFLPKKKKTKERTLLEKMNYEVRKFNFDERLTDEQLDELIATLKQSGFNYEGKMPNTNLYSFSKFYK